MAKAIVLDEEGKILLNKARSKLGITNPEKTITYNMTVKEALKKYIGEDNK